MSGGTLTAGDIVRLNGPVNPRCFALVIGPLPGAGLRLRWTWNGGLTWGNHAASAAIHVVRCGVTVRTQDDANRWVPRLLNPGTSPRVVRIVADRGWPIDLSRIRPLDEAVGIDAINGAWTNGTTSEAWPALTRVIVEGEDCEWVRLLQLDCRAAVIGFELAITPTGQGSQR